MFKITAYNKNCYTVKSIKHKENGITFEYQNEIVFLPHSNIKEISSFEPVSAKGYVKHKLSR